jgi:hypothetical protein
MTFYKDFADKRTPAAEMTNSLINGRLGAREGKTP